MMRSFLFYFLLYAFCFYSCNNSGQQHQENKTVQAAQPSFTISLKPINVQLPDSFPFLQSFVWARQGNKILLIGGRIEGFHGRTGINIFPEKKANTSVWVVDLSNFSSKELPLNKNYAGNLQFFSSNMEFCQDGDTLYLIGGYGAGTVTSSRSNTTFDRLVALDVSATIKAVESQSATDLNSMLLSSIESNFLRVAGGELVKSNGTFYLAFGQDFEGTYDAGKNGNYTSAIRSFQISQDNVADTSSYIDTNLHRRDLPLATVVQPNTVFYAAFGGVFTKDGDGYANPVYFNPNPFSVTVDTLQQITNQYDCAIVNIYDPSSTASFSVLLGGIGKYQYDTATRQWKLGDGKMLLPFVKSITQMKFQNGVMSQYIQLPPQQPEMPGLLGANAVFFPRSNLVNANGVIDYSKIQSDTTSIGFMYGGIQSLRPTSNSVYPTTLNKTVYEVFLNKSAFSKNK